jgi:hypothetical protein
MMGTAIMNLSLPLGQKTSQRFAGNNCCKCICGFQKEAKEMGLDLFACGRIGHMQNKLFSAKTSRGILEARIRHQSLREDPASRDALRGGSQ